ncbi:MAG: hypothetical protein KZQ88_10900 [Candidatus Thiodiazotropha sp. (ex Dulcina madagascariensis)]|nr:hypothetical protein [Candidatus Thiodiazotropha sp. (ex Dulcina madagascariensis)]MCU7925133.1 hypothetical protein [Candidatus Thiodiazotropha sp. (ex Dulcina madagascariensis)]
MKLEQVCISHDMAFIGQSVLFGFWNNQAEHLERSGLNHRPGYASALDRPTCFGLVAPKIQILVRNAG